jgi:hypothetical protein
MHAPGALGGAELESLDQQRDINTEHPRRFHLSSRERILQAFNRASKFGSGQSA